MPDCLDDLIQNLSSSDDTIRSGAFNRLMEITDTEVAWFDEYADALVALLDDGNSFKRSIAVMLLCNLAKSDFGNRISDLLPRILEGFEDEKFVTRRQCLQHIWKIAAAKPSLREEILSRLTDKFDKAPAEKHYNLIRRDVLDSLHSLFLYTSDPELGDAIEGLVDSEEDEKYRKDYRKRMKGN